MSAKSIAAIRAREAARRAAFHPPLPKARKQPAKVEAQDTVNERAES